MRRDRQVGRNVEAAKNDIRKEANSDQVEVVLVGLVYLLWLERVPDKETNTSTYSTESITAKQFLVWYL